MEKLENFWKKIQKTKNTTVPSADVVEIQKLFWGKFISYILLPESCISPWHQVLRISPHRRNPILAQFRTAKIWFSITKMALISVRIKVGNWFQREKVARSIGFKTIWWAMGLGIKLAYENQFKKLLKMQFLLSKWLRMMG